MIGQSGLNGVQSNDDLTSGLDEIEDECSEEEEEEEECEDGDDSDDDSKKAN